MQIQRSDNVCPYGAFARKNKKTKNQLPDNQRRHVCVCVCVCVCVSVRLMQNWSHHFSNQNSHNILPLTRFQPMSRRNNILQKKLTCHETKLHDHFSAANGPLSVGWDDTLIRNCPTSHRLRGLPDNTQEFQTGPLWPWVESRVHAFHNSL